MQVVMGALNGALLLNLLNESAGKTTRIRAAVAYAEPNHPLFAHCKERRLPLVYYGLLDEGEAVSPALLRSFLDQGPSRVSCRLVRGYFHPKVIWWERFGVYIGSANLTHAAWYKNVECGVFYKESEMAKLGIDAELNDMFDHLQKNSIALTTELLTKIESLANDRKSADEARSRLKSKFDKLFEGVPANPALTVVPPKGTRENRAQKEFVREWMDTLQTLRGLTVEFEALGKRPKWVAPDAHPAIHFDQFLHAYYYDYVRHGLGDPDDEDDDTATSERVENSFERNKGNPGRALLEGAKWWAGLKEAPYGEDEFIAVTGPRMAKQFSPAAIEKMSPKSFRDAMRNVNAFRMHARQMKNSFFGLPPGHKESLDERLGRLTDWLWSEAATESGNGVQDVLSFVIWAHDPPDMEQRLWMATRDPAWRLEHLGKSTLGETIGWARPDDYPPRNNRTNKALRALGHDVALFDTL
jgi:hypothetical protein